MKVRRRRFATLVFVWGAFCFAPCLAELRSFQMPPKTIHIIHMYHKGDGPDPFPWASIGGPIPPGASALNTGGDQNGDGWPSFNINPVTGEGECTWSRNNGGQMDIAFSETSVGVWNDIVLLTSSAESERDPRLAFSSSTGGTKIVYWLDNGSPQVFMIERNSATVPWSAPILVSDSSGPARYPSDAVAQGRVHVGYEVERAASGKDIIVSGRPENGTGPFSPEVVAHVSYGGKAEVILDQGGSKVWATWVNSDSDVGYSVFDGTHWGVPQFWPYSSSDDIDTVRFQIRLSIIEGN